MIMVKVSVIVPVYNVEKYLEECLDSIINQTLEDIEIICVNDGSTDNSLSILESFAKKEDRIKIISQENQGLAAARNLGLDNVNGDYVFFIDSDDFLELNALEELYNIAVEKSLDFVLYKLINYDDETKEYYTMPLYEMPKLRNFVGEKVFNYNDLGKLIFNIAVSAVCKLYDKDFIKKTGARFPEGLIFEDNVFFWEILFNAERIYFVDKHYYKRRRHLNSITGTANIKHADTLIIHNMIFDIFKKHNLFNEFKKELFNQKISLADRRFLTVSDGEKAEFFDKMKKDFEEMVEEYGYGEILNQLKEKEKAVFQNVIISKSSDEYLILRKKYTLEKNIKKLNANNKKLKKEINSIKKENNLMLNSKSWKITKPMRFITNLFR